MDVDRWMVRIACIAGVGAALYAVSGVAQAAEPGPGSPVRLQEVMGRKALDSGGGATGWVEDVLLDGAAARITGFVVAHDGRSVRVPFDGVRYEGDRLLLPLDDHRMDKLPRWKAASTADASARAWLDKPLLARDGDTRIATVKDLLVDLPGARVTHVVLEFDPAVKQAEGWLAVPADDVRRDGASLRAEFDPRNLHDRQPRARQAKAAPEAPHELPGMDARLGSLPGRVVAAPDGTALAKVTGTLVDLKKRRIAALLVARGGDQLSCRVGPQGLTLGREVVHAPQGASSLDQACVPAAAGDRDGLVRGRELLGARFHDPRGQTVGRLADVVLRAEDGRFHYLVGDFDATWVQDGKLVALPLREVRRDGDGFAIHATLMEMMYRPVFDAQRLQDAWSPAFAAGMERYLATAPSSAQ